MSCLFCMLKVAESLPFAWSVENNTTGKIRAVLIFLHVLASTPTASFGSALCLRRLIPGVRKPEPPPNQPLMEFSRESSWEMRGQRASALCYRPRSLSAWLHFPVEAAVLQAPGSFQAAPPTRCHGPWGSHRPTSSPCHLGSGVIMASC